MDLEGFQQLGAMAMAKQASPSVPVRFYVEAMQDPEKSKNGRPVFVDTDMIEKHVGKDIIRRPATIDDQQEHAVLWAAHKAGQSQEKVEGMPLREWPPIRREQAESLNLVGIRTVEQFAACPDTTLQGVGPLMALRQLARDWLEDAKKGAGIAQLRNRLSALESENETLKAMLARQAADIEAARQNGGALPTAPAAPAGPNPEIEAMKAQLAALAAAVRVTGAPVMPPPCVDGSPSMSPNAPGVPATTTPKRRGRPPKAKPENTNGV